MTSRRSRLARGVSGDGTEAPDKACAGVARSTAREPTQAAPAAASVTTTAAGAASTGNSE